MKSSIIFAIFLLSSAFHVSPHEIQNVKQMISEENIITKTETAEKDSLEIETVAGEDTERNSHVDAEEIGNFRMELKAKENAKPENEPDVEEEVSLEHEVELETIELAKTEYELKAVPETEEADTEEIMTHDAEVSSKEKAKENTKKVKDEKAMHEAEAELITEAVKAEEKGKSEAEKKARLEADTKAAEESIILEIEEKANPDLCTYLRTGSSFLVQEYYFCHTCGLDEKKPKGVCKVCVKSCHAGHDVKFARHDLSCCDCGMEGERSCRSLLKIQFGMYTKQI